MKRPRALWAALLLAAGLFLLVPTPRALDVDDVLRLKQSGVSEETILRVVEDARAVLRLSVDDILDLKNAGCSDDLIRALLETPERFGPDGNENAYEDEDFGLGAYDGSLYDDDYETVFIHHYYDPFGYGWYAWPTAYYYRSPFWWSYSGFYYAGHWCWDWWDPWGPCTWYCDSRWGWDHHHGPSHTRVTARRVYEPHGRGAASARMHRESGVYRRAGLALAPEMRVRSSAEGVRPPRKARLSEGTRSLRSPADSPRTRGGDRASYRSGRTLDTSAPATPRVTRPRRGGEDSRTSYPRTDSPSSRSRVAPQRTTPSRPATPSRSPSVAPSDKTRSTPPPAPARESKPQPASPRSGETRSRTRL